MCGEVVQVDVQLANNDVLPCQLVKVPDKQHKPAIPEYFDGVDRSEQTGHHLMFPLQIFDGFILRIERSLDFLRAFKLRNKVGIAANLEMLFQLNILNFKGGNIFLMLSE